MDRGWVAAEVGPKNFRAPHASHLQTARKIASRAPSVKACYEAALRDNPEVGGKIRGNFTVGTAGTVTDVQVIGAQGTLADCIEAKFRTIRGLPILSQARAFNQMFLLARD